MPDIRRQGFGREVRDALRQRADRLVERGHAVRGEDGSVQLRRGFLGRAGARGDRARRQRHRAPDRPTGEGGRIEGRYARPVDLQSGRYALIENERSFRLVP